MKCAQKAVTQFIKQQRCEVFYSRLYMTELWGPAYIKTT